jgi:hypothetical protein
MVLAAAVDRVTPMTEAVAFAARRWLTFLAAPLYPLLFILVLGVVVLGLFGLLFYVPVLNIVAGLLYVLPLALGWVMALLLVLWFAGVHLIYPAVSAQGSDALDAMARSFSYVMSRPWRLFFYTLVALLYGAATYLFVGLFIYLMLSLAYWGAGMFGGLSDVFQAPRFGQWPQPHPDADNTDAVTAFFIRIWTYLVIATLGAYALSYYLAAYSQIYLLLRQHTDGDDPSDVFEPQPPQPPLASDKIEPATAPLQAPSAAVAPDSIEDVEPPVENKPAP